MSTDVPVILRNWNPLSVVAPTSFFGPGLSCGRCTLDQPGMMANSWRYPTCPRFGNRRDLPLASCDAFVHLPASGEASDYQHGRQPHATE